VPIYEDLLPYLDADPELGRESIIPSLLTALLREEEVLYMMPYQFAVFAFFAPIDLVGDRSSITMREAEIIAERNDLFVFDDEISKEWLLDMACNILINRYIDLKAGTCDFDNPDFIAMLEECNKHRFDSEHYEPEPIRCLLRRHYLFGIGGYDWIRQYNYCFIGFPLSGESNGAIMTNWQFGISSQSAHKEGAWEFIRHILSSENQQKAQDIPVVLKELELQFDKALKGEFENFLGDKIKYEQSDIDRIWDIIERSSYLISEDQIIWDVIKEEAGMYFAGDRTVEDTVRVIQDRLSKYVAEQS
jgi:hypothetical protein